MKLCHLSTVTINRLNTIGQFLPQLGLRLLLAYEFWESGLEKFHGANWFNEIHDKFPFPLHLLPTDTNWFLATWSEILGAIMLLIGLGTRLSAATLIFVTVIAWITSHPGGYTIADGGFKLPLLFLAMLVPLLFSGPGKASLDYVIAKRHQLAH